jgi:hypothetical protein
MSKLGFKKTTNAYLHNKLGHPHKQALIEAAKHYGIELQKQTDETVCIEYSLSKIRVKNLGSNEENNSKAKGERLAIDISSINKVKGERLSMDISSINKVSYRGSKFCLLIQDEYTVAFGAIF